ncbi:MAG TPA: helix-turn-helix domain-containing protein [Caldisericia bacterium]|nr:helix-turn-helix domain-containing protein [Caldisericia bacterium]
MIEKEELYTPEEVAKLLKVPLPTVRKWLWKGRLKGVKAGNLWRVRKKDIENFLKSEK